MAPFAFFGVCGTEGSGGAFGGGGGGGGGGGAFGGGGGGGSWPYLSLNIFNCESSLRSYNSLVPFLNFTVALLVFTLILMPVTLAGLFVAGGMVS